MSFHLKGTHEVVTKGGGLTMIVSNYRKSQMFQNLEAIMHSLPSILKLKQLDSFLSQLIFLFQMSCIHPSVMDPILCCFFQVKMEKNDY